MSARNVSLYDSNNQHSPQQRQPQRNYSNCPPQQQQEVQDRNYSTNSLQQKSYAPERNYCHQQQPQQWHQNRNEITSTGSPSPAGSEQRFRTLPVNSNRGTTLSPWAKEFRPSGNMTMMNMQEESELGQTVAQTQMLNLNRTSSVNFSQGEYSNPPRNEVDSMDNDNMDCIHQVLSTVTDAMTDLTLHPANFSRCSKTITEVLKNYLTDTDTLGSVVTLLIEQSITNPNFCYSGARLSQVLHKSQVAVGTATFNNLFLTQCQEQFSYCINNMEQYPETQMRSRGLLMFFAELFVNIRIEKAPGVTIPIFGLSVIKMMQKLVKVKDTSHENVKSVFQVLKLVGWDLENSSSAQVKTEFETLVKDLSDLKGTSKTMKPQTKLLLETLFELISKKWKREEYTEESTSVPISPAASTSASYGTNIVYEMPESDEEDYDETGLMLDDEPAQVQKAYDQFLKDISRK